MKGENLIRGLGCIDEKYIIEAEEAEAFRIHIPAYDKAWIAACLSLLILAGCLLPWYLKRAEDQIQVQDTAVCTMENESKYSIPESIPDPHYVLQETAHSAVEVPSVILRVEEWNENGFMGTVAELVDTDIFDLGTVLRAEFDQDLCTMRADSFDAAQKTVQMDTGTLVRVMFTDYDADTGTIQIESLEPANERED